jgi:hypothetical protein
LRILGAHLGSTPVIRTLKFTAIYFMACMLLTLAWPLFLSKPLLSLLLAAAAANTFYSMIWAARIGSAIAREREIATYDLICLIPAGALGAGWALSSAHLHRSSLFRMLRLLMHSLAAALMGALLTTIPVMLTLASGSPASYGLFLLLDYGVAAAAAFYLDHIQSLTLAYLIGMTTAAMAQNRINAQLWAVSGFLLLQMLTYLFTLIIALVLLPMPQAPLHMSDIALRAVTPLLWLASFYTLREILIRLMWRILARQFNASPTDQRDIFRTFVR